MSKLFKLLLLFIIFIPFNNKAQTKEKALIPENVTFQDLKFSASIYKEKYLLMEPIPITLNVENSYNTDIIGDADPDFYHDDSNLSLTVIHNEKKREILTFSYFLSSDCCVYIGLPTIKAKQRKSEVLILSLGIESLFPEEGDYILQFSLRDRYRKELNQTIQSNLLKVSVFYPKGKELQAYKEYIDKDLQNFIQKKELFLLDKDNLGEDKSFNFVVSNESSNYATYVINTLIEYYSRLESLNEISDKQMLRFSKLKKL